MPFGLAFGALTSQANLTLWQATAFSVLVFSGSAQFAAVDVLRQGGTVVAAVIAGLMLNLRSLSFGIALAPSLRGPIWKRALQSHLIIDESAAVALSLSDHIARVRAVVFTGSVMFTAWNIATIAGRAIAGANGDLVSSFGLDATVPAAFLALLWPRLADYRQRRVAIVSMLIAVLGVPLLPRGLPIVISSAAAVAGLGSTRT